MSTVRERIMAALRGSGRPMSANAVGTRLGYEAPPGWLRGEVEKLVEEDKVEKCGGCDACGSGQKYIAKKVP